MNNSDCIALNQCVGMCAAQDQACVDGCAAMNAVGIEDYNAVVMCIGGQCASCGNSMPACDSMSTCDACVACAEAGDCLDEKESCSNLADCAALLACVGACPEGDSACLGNCSSQYPNGFARLQTLQECIYISQCPMACQ